jgi:hypothetical protein
MTLTDILNRVNKKLAGELLSYDEIKDYLDDVVDEINSKLSSKFPAFSDFTAQTYPQFPDYNFFPDNYIRSVVVIGAAFKFYVTDEEGAMTAQKYELTYNNNLFLMQRDYTELVPEEYRNYETGYMIDPNVITTETDIVDAIWGDI